MDDFLKGDSGAVYIFLYLLPGFLGSATFDYLVEGEPRETFDKIVFALSMTLLSSLTVSRLFGMPLVQPGQNRNFVCECPDPRNRAPGDSIQGRGKSHGSTL